MLTPEIGSTVRIINCYEASKYIDEVFTVKSEPRDLCGNEVVTIESEKKRFVAFSLECLEVI